MLKKIVFALVMVFNFSPVVHALTEEEVSKQLKCQCGCGFPDLASCSCGEWAIPAKNEIRARINRGEDMPTILKYFVDRHGEAILTSPVQEGFNIAAWLVPTVAILVAGGLLSVALYRWKNKDVAMEQVAKEERKNTGSPAGENKEYLDRLHEEIYGPKED